MDLSLIHISFMFPGIPQPVKLGLAGGPLIVSILISRFGPQYKMITYLSLIHICCGATFDCMHNDILSCHCATVRLDALQRTYLMENYSDCLCHDCLKVLSARNLTARGSDVRWNITTEDISFGLTENSIFGLSRV